MSKLPSDTTNIQMPPRTIQRVRAGHRPCARPHHAHEAIRPAQDYEQSARRSDDVAHATENPNPAIESGPTPPACVEQLNEGTRANSDFFTRNNVERPEIIAGLIREGQLGVLVGTYGVGKSPLLAHVQICALNGIAWCGREVQKRPVIGFDLESAGPMYKRNLLNLAERFGVSLPRVPDDLEAYLEQDSPTEPATAKLLEILKFENLSMRATSLIEMLMRKRNALVIIDPLELLFRIDTRDKMNVIGLYVELKELLAYFPRAAILFTVNLRKKDRRAQGVPSLLTDPRDWLEEVSGSLDVLNRCDVRLGMDFYGVEGVRVINGIRRGEDMHPLLIRPVHLNDEPDRPAGFERVPPAEVELLMTLTGKLHEYWLSLPAEFTFEQATAIMGKSNFDRLKKRTTSLGVLEPTGRGHYRKLNGQITSQQ